MCEISHENNLNDINEKYINPDLSNLLNVLATLMKTCNKLKLNLKIKNAKIVQGYMKKKKWYVMPRILYWDKYIDAPRQANLANQLNLTCNQVIEETPAPL